MHSCVQGKGDSSGQLPLFFSPYLHQRTFHSVTVLGQGFPPPFAVTEAALPADQGKSLEDVRGQTPKCPGAPRSSGLFQERTVQREHGGRSTFDPVLCASASS